MQQRSFFGPQRLVLPGLLETYDMLSPALSPLSLHVALPISILKFTHALIAVAVLSLAEPAIAQTKRASYGPVVKAYLTGLDEELTELEFQLRDKEITREIYDRTKIGRAHV